MGELITRTSVAWITPVCFRKGMLFLEDDIRDWQYYQLSNAVSGLELSGEWGKITENYSDFPSVITVDYPSEDCKPVLRKPASPKYLPVIPSRDFKRNSGIDELLGIPQKGEAFWCV